MQDDRRAILARRARLVAAAVAGAGLGSCAANPAAAPPTSHGTEIVVPEPEGGTEEATDAELPGRAAAPEAAAPKPPESYPRICLSEY